MTLLNISKNAILPIQFDNTVAYDEWVSADGHRFFGQINKQTKRSVGIVRVIYKHGELYEGQSKDDSREGYGRFIRADGSYYLGGV